jgi:hypothetical protein
MRLTRGAQIARLLRAAYDVELPDVDAVVAEARGRSRPLKRKRRVRLVLNYLYCVLRARGGPLHKLGGMARVPAAMLGRRR